MKYKVTVVQVVYGDVFVEADSTDEAMQKAKEEHKQIVWDELNHEFFDINDVIEVDDHA